MRKPGRRPRKAIDRHWIGEAGLTLVEMLVVLAIIAVMAGVTVLAIGTGDRDRASGEEARRLAARLRLAADDVRISERRLAFVWDHDGYKFVDWDAKAGAWRADPVEELGRHDLPRGLRLDAGPGSGSLPIAPDGTGGPIDLKLGTEAARWTIHFDGLDATASRPDAKP
ncbi:prepilin-type N-terminal cleavage/methylation domain-containing protein [Sphingomonas bacterium]|uniref:prepilin-type N-terminal cleavage/methylation domain-containing protein n=1 Tax=Sphingomonas bacterium TaxID=1895847 RepID=UPI0015760ED3|nr:prepilin-type N-terminal cleavage/methylation domain-containing protein [Sphingomonas bacterium]